MTFLSLGRKALSAAYQLVCWLDDQAEIAGKVDRSAQALRDAQLELQITSAKRFTY